MKLLLTYVLVLCILLSGCSRAVIPGESVAPSVPEPVDPDYSVDYGTGYVRAGRVRAVVEQDGADSRVSFREVYAGTPGKDHTDPEFYTLRDSIPATTGMKWAPHTWETADDAYILDLTTTGFYSLLLNREGTGYTVSDEMALGLPEDVTGEYAGRFGIAPGEQARAWKINLNPDACWDNGVPIDADTYIYSYRQLLDNKMRNRRADSLYGGDFAIVGAREYLYRKGNEVTWDQVGILKTGDYQLVFITTAPVSSPDFYVPYYLSSTYLVYEPLWESCKTYLDKDGKVVSADSDRVATVSTNYCTSLDTSISYGPYRLTFFELDKQITLDRNPAWYGYWDGRHSGQYQTDRISCQVISSHATALLAFLKGDLDSIDLESADMDRYALSDRIRYTPESYTTKLSFNTDVQALRKRGSQVLANPLFRKAFALALDRTRFAASYTSAGVPGYGLLNEVYVYDPFTGAAYRHTDGAKNALVQLSGLSPGDYGGLEGAYSAITGYEPDGARALMAAAFDACMASGLYDGKAPITLQLSVYQSSDTYVQMYQFLKDALEAVCRGTGFEGKISLEMAVDADYYATMESGLTDIIFSTWGGSAYDPYSLLYQCYCDKGVAAVPNQMEYGFDAGKVTVEMEINEEIFVASLQDWARWCSADLQITLRGEKGTVLQRFGAYDAQTRAAVYANLEFAYLSQYAVTSLYYRNGAELLSRKGDYPVTDYVGLVEFGGLPFYTFHYTDAQWERVKANLQY